ncbi:MAG: hypothetical protein R3A79_16240 [Nannocystaceae bacterium]
MDVFFLILAPIGVLAAIGLTWIFGGLSDARLGDAEEAARRLAELEPGFESDEVTLAEGGAGALVLGRRDRRPAIAALIPFGDRLVSRVLSPKAVVAVEAADDGVLRLRLGDYTSPRIALRLPAGEAQRWRARIEEAARA